MAIEDDTTIFCKISFLDKQGRPIKSIEVGGAPRVLPVVIRDMAKKVGIGGGASAIVPYSVYFKDMSPEVELPTGEDVRVSLDVQDAIPAGMALKPDGKRIGLLVADMDKNGVAETLKGGDWEKMPKSYKWIDKNYTRPIKTGGVAENREWVGPKTALFMIGRKTGDVGLEDLVGTYTGGMVWDSAYEVLKQFDSDDSGRLEGWEMDEIFVWLDQNSDARAQDEEIAEARDVVDSIVLMPSDIAGLKSRSKNGVKFRDGTVAGTWEWPSRASK